MSKLYLTYGLPSEKDKFTYLIPSFRSNDFKDIENKWKVYLPFNKVDLVWYKT